MHKPFIFIFPGQGSQKVGMGEDLFKNHHIAREVFEEVDEILKTKLSKIIFKGPDNDLTLTQNTQPAIMSVSLAIIRVLEYELKKKISNFVELVMGHSLGEYSALSSVNLFSLADTAKILRIRGESMQNSVKNIETKMIAVIGLDIEKVKQSMEKIQSNSDSICEIANDNSPGQVILSGTKNSVDEVGEYLKDIGAKKIIPLNVSAPFHCSLMKKTSEKIKETLEKIVFKKIETRFISNVTANFEEENQKIKQLLIEQVSKTVRWRESVLRANELQTKKIVEIGPGKVLSGLNRRIGVKNEIENISNLSELDSFLEHNRDILK